VLQLGAFSLVRDRMWPEDLLALVLKLLGIYSVPLGIILGGIFAQPKGPLHDPPAGVAWAALLLAAIWNLPLVWRSISFGLAQQDSVGDLIKYLDSVASASSFLVAGVLAFFFAKTMKPAGSSK